jgi:hypothetical protein
MNGSMTKRSRGQNVSLLLSLLIVGCGIGWLAGLSLSPVISIVLTSVVATTATLIAIVSGLEDRKTIRFVETVPKNHAENADEKELPPLPLNDNIVWRVPHISPWPIAVLVLGLLIGTTLGNLARTNDLLGNRFIAISTEMVTPIEEEILFWSAYGIGKNEVAQRIFASKYPETASSPVPVIAYSQQASAQQTGLFNSGLIVEQAECEVISRVGDAELESLVLGEQNSDETGADQRVEVATSESDTGAGGLQNATLVELFYTIEDPLLFRQVVDILCVSSLP